MKVWLLYPYSTPMDNNAFGWFREAFRESGMDLEVYFWGAPGVAKSELVSLELSAVVKLKKEIMPDGVLMRGYNSGLSMWFEMHHRKVVNCCKSMEYSRDKLITARMLESAGIPIPRTLSYVSQFPIALPFQKESFPDNCFPKGFPPYARLSQDFQGFPFVMKLSFGSKGEDVYLIENEESYLTAVQSCIRTRNERMAFFDAAGGRWTEYGAWKEEVEHGCEPIFQEYIAFSHGRDLRIWVVDGKVAGHVLRHNSTSFKSNFAQGGVADSCPLPQLAADIAISATKCLGLDFAGVDLLFTGDGFDVCEINGNAGFRTTSEVGGMNIPKALAQMFLY